MSPNTLLMIACLTAKPDVVHLEHCRNIELNDGIVRSVVFSPDGTIVAGCGNRFAQLIDVQTGERLHRFEGHLKPVVSIAFSPDGKLLASASEDGSIRVWDIESTTTVHVVSNATNPKNPHPPRQVVFSPDGKTLVACYLMYRDRTQTVLYNTENGKWFYDARQPRPESPLHLAFSPDGSAFAIAKDSGNITIMDVVEFGVRERFIPPRIILGQGLDSTRYPLKHDGERPVSHVAFSRDGKWLLSCGGDNTIRVWNSKAVQSILVIKGPNETRCLQAAAFSPNGTCIISATNNEIIQVWDARSGKLLAADRGTDEDVRRLAVSPDGRVLATCGGEGVIKLWQITNN